MDTEEYQKYGKEMVDYIAHYLNTVGERRVFPDVSPGYMRDLVASEVPEKGENWQTILADVERVVMPGMTHWQSPHMHAYFPATHSYPALLGDMLSDAINALGFTWASSPAVTELEVIVMDWLAKAIGLPRQFMHSNEGSHSGGGVIQTTCSEATFVALLAARTEAIKRLRKQKELSSSSDAVLVSQLVAYCSEQAHSSVEKAGLISLVKLRLLPTDDEHKLRADALHQAINEDKQNGLTPFFLCATLGTTGCCSFDCLQELGPICEKEDIWLHVDAAYAGSAFVCPEYRYLLQGVEYAQSFVFNPSKWLLVNFDCTAMWVTNSGSLHCTFNVDPLYLQHENSGDAIDYMHWQIPLSRRFRALKLWFVMRSYGLEGLQSHIRKSVGLGKFFEQLVRKDDRFEIPAKRYLGLVVLRLKGHNSRTEQLLKNLNRQGRIHMVPASLKGTYVIRFTVTSTKTTEQDLLDDWRLIQKEADRLTDNLPADASASKVTPTAACPRPGIKRRSTWSHHNRDWDFSLLLSNVPVHPNVVNGTFAALYNSMDYNTDKGQGLSLVASSSRNRRKMGTRRVKSLDAGLMPGESHTPKHKTSFEMAISELSSDSSREDSPEWTDDEAGDIPQHGPPCQPADLNKNVWLPGSANQLLEKFANIKMFRKLRLAAGSAGSCEMIPSPVAVQKKDERNGHYGVDG